MYENGMEVSTDNGVIKVRVLLLQMTCDAPAKCLFQNFKQFNEKYGCPYCLHPGESVFHGGRSRSYVYDYRKEDDCGKRNHRDTLKHANEAYQNKFQGKSKFDVSGVKGLSWGMFLPHFDIIESVCIYFMHAVLLGVMKQLMTLWFGSSHKAATWSCYGNIKTVQDRLLNIKPTNSITRVPRSLEELNHWKASEFRAWILFYGHVCLYEILADEYYQHFLLLAEAVWLLLQEDISDAEIEQADRYLQYFCFQIEHLYDKRALTFNNHQLLHLVQNVKNHGPLWTNSCFYFEDCNGQLRHFFHGTQNVENQVLRTVSVIQSLPKLAKKLDPGSELETLYSVMKGSRPKMRCMETIDTDIIAVGTQSVIDKFSTRLVLACIEEVFPHFNGDIAQFNRLLLHGQMIHILSYHRVEQRNSFTVEYSSDKFGQIISFYKFSGGCLCPFSAIQCVCGKKTACFAAIAIHPVLHISFVKDTLTGLKMNQDVWKR